MVTEKRNTTARPDNGQNVTGRAYQFIPMAITITIEIKGGTIRREPVIVSAKCDGSNVTTGDNIMSEAIRLAIDAGMDAVSDSAQYKIIKTSEPDAN